MCESVHMGVCVWVLAYVFGFVRVCVLERVWDVETAGPMNIKTVDLKALMSRTLTPTLVHWHSIA